MGYDMYIVKTKKKTLNELKENTKLSLSDLWSYGFLEEITSDEVWSISEIFCRYFKEHNLKCDLDICIELSHNQLFDMRLWLENYLKTTLFDELDKVEDSDISILFSLLKQLNKFIETLKEDEVVLFEHD